MRVSLKNYLLLNKIKKYLVIIFIWPSLYQAQIANYVSNGGFEKVVPSVSPPEATYWRAIDSTKYFGGTLSKILPPFNVPLSSFAYQWPKEGNNYFISTFFYSTGQAIRGYPLNRLKYILNPGTTYCVKFYYNTTNQSSYGIDGIGAYFGNSQMDTITNCTKALTYISPQVQNITGNVITDTLNWIPITGTFVANGTEKYMVLGNFKSDALTNTVLINPTNLPEVFCEVLLDAVSCIDIDLPAFAGRDTSIIAGDSIFVGREPDIGIDEACMWYKLPTVITPTTAALDTVAGFWIKPVTSCTYIVRQQLWCSGVKWDTVVIHMNPVGIEKLKILTEELKLFPVPAKDELQLSIHNAALTIEFHSLSIFNNLGLLIREEETKFQNGSFKINTADLPSGVYSLQLKSSSNETVSKRFVISR
jgi:hypothetical protein